MKIRFIETTPRAFLEEEMRYQLEDAKIEVPEEDFNKGVDMIYNGFILPNLPKFLNKKGLVSVPGFFLISAACKKTIDAMKKQQKKAGN